MPLGVPSFDGWRQLSNSPVRLSCAPILSVSNTKLAVHGDTSKSSCVCEFYGLFEGVELENAIWPYCTVAILHSGLEAVLRGGRIMRQPYCTVAILYSGHIARWPYTRTVQMRPAGAEKKKGVHDDDQYAVLQQLSAHLQAVTASIGAQGEVQPLPSQCRLPERMHRLSSQHSPRTAPINAPSTILSRLRSPNLHPTHPLYSWTMMLLPRLWHHHWHVQSPRRPDPRRLTPAALGPSLSVRSFPRPVFKPLPIAAEIEESEVY